MVTKKITAYIVTLVLMLAGVLIPLSTSAFAQDRDDLVRQKQQRAQQMREVKASLEGVDVNIQKTFLQLESTRLDIKVAEQNIAQAEAEVVTATRKAEENAALLQVAQSELQTLARDKNIANKVIDSSRSNLGALARATYRGEVSPSTIDLILGSSSAEDFLNAYRVNSAVSRVQTAALTESEQKSARIANKESRQSAVEAKIAELKAEADALVEKKNAALTLAEKRRKDLATLESNFKSQSTKLASQKAAYQQSLKNMAAEQRSVEAEIAKIDAENARRAKAAAAAAAAQQNSGASSSGAQTNTTSSSRYWLKPPIPAPLYVTSPQGWRRHPITGRSNLHRGVDLGSPCGQTQRVAAAGTVSRIIWASSGFAGGNTVYVNHGTVNGSSWVTTHMHLSVVKVRVGQRLSAGSVVGLTGDTGWVTGCHVHFEVWKNGRVINPMGLPGFTRRYRY